MKSIKKYKNMRIKKCSSHNMIGGTDDNIITERGLLDEYLNIVANVNVRLLFFGGGLSILTVFACPVVFVKRRKSQSYHEVPLRSAACPALRRPAFGPVAYGRRSMLPRPPARLSGPVCPFGRG